MEPNHKIILKNTPSNPTKKKLHHRAKDVVVKRKVATFVVVVLVLAIGSSLFFYGKYQETQDKLNNPDRSASEQANILVGKISNHVVLPTGEQPTVATVSDTSKLASQTFFSGAQNGDKVLIYAKSKKAILYRPSIDRVINISSLNVNLSQ